MRAAEETRGWRFIIENEIDISVACFAGLLSHSIFTAPLA
jgi:hypothetical protein